MPYCPVRPHQFGYYGTRWRKWPGQDIVQVSGEATKAPVEPPRSAVPGPAEESLAPPTGEEPADDAGGNRSAADREPPSSGPLEPAPMPAPPQEPEPMPATEPAVTPAEPAVEGESEPQAEPQPDDKKPEPTPGTEPAPKRPEDENLFEVLSGPGWRAKRKFAVGAAAGEDAVRPASHAAPDAGREVPRVPFDPAAETRRLRTAR